MCDVINCNPCNNCHLEQICVICQKFKCTLPKYVTDIKSNPLGNVFAENCNKFIHFIRL